jgi:hypothetical protein
MGLSNSPNGISSFGMPVLPGMDRPYTGKAYFVNNQTNSNGSNGNSGLSPSQPFSTLAYAVTQVTSNNDDVIYVLEGHTETIAVAGGIACASSGFSIVGLGNGRKRPTFTWSATGSTWTIAGSNVSLKNLVTTSTVAGVVSMFAVTGAGVTFDTVDYYEDGTTDALQFILTTATADDLTVQNCRWHRGTTAASALSQWIVLTGADRCKITNNFGVLKGFATSNPINSWIAVVTTACLAIEITHNRLYDSNSTGNVPILTIASTTGIVSNNLMGTSATTTTISYNSCFAFQNFISNEVAKSGAVSPAIDTLT